MDQSSVQIGRIFHPEISFISENLLPRAARAPKPILHAMATCDKLDRRDVIDGPATVAIVKWDRFCAHAIRQTVEEIFPATKVLVCHSGAETLAALLQSPVQVGIFGLGLPDVDGLDLIIRMTKERLVERLLVVSTRNDEHSCQILRSVRIAGFFDCQIENGDNLGTAVRQVGCGGRYFSPDRLEPGRTRRPTLNQILSKTELQVLAVIGDGSSDQDAAERLGLSAKTVHCHRQHIMRKLDIQTRAVLMRTAIERGVIRFSANRVLRPGMEQVLSVRQLSTPGEPG